VFASLCVPVCATLLLASLLLLWLFLVAWCRVVENGLGTQGSIARIDWVVHDGNVDGYHGVACVVFSVGVAGAVGAHTILHCVLCDATSSASDGFAPSCTDTPIATWYVSVDPELYLRW
jgi:hypothetical protein